MAREESPSCILLGYGLSDITGLEFISKFSTYPSANYTAIIILTDKGNEVVAVSALKDGAMDYLVKERLTAGALNRAIPNAVDKVIHVSITDELTSVRNPRYTMVRLTEGMERSKRYSTPLSILMFDLNHFRQVNDVCGHIAGDEVLKSFSQILMGLSRSTDIVGWFGGEEFVVVLTETQEYYTHRYAERICELLRDSKHQISAGTKIQVACSIGVTSYNKSLTSVSSFVARAESTLYKAKDSGRDRVCLWPHVDKSRTTPSEPTMAHDE